MVTEVFGWMGRMGLRPQNAPGAPPAPSSYLSRRWRPGPGSHRDLQRGSATFRDMNNMIKQEDRHAQRAAGPPPSPWRRPCRAHNAWGSAMRTCRAHPRRLPPLTLTRRVQWCDAMRTTMTVRCQTRRKSRENKEFALSHPGAVPRQVRWVRGRAAELLRGPPWRSPPARAPGCPRLSLAFLGSPFVLKMVRTLSMHGVI